MIYFIFGIESRSEADCEYPRDFSLYLDNGGKYKRYEYQRNQDQRSIRTKT